MVAKTLEAKQQQAAYMKMWRAKNKERIAADLKEWKANNVEHVQAYQKAYHADYRQLTDVQAAFWKRSLWRNYKMTPAEFNDMWAKQSGQCLICEVHMRPRGRHAESVCVDHNHETGAVRGLLCRNCNHGLGMFTDNPKSLRAAAAYLEEKGFYGTP